MTTEQHLIGSRILNEIRARGYHGSAAAFYRLWSPLRPTQPDPRVTERFETAPGEQSQFDWSPYTILLGGARTRIIMYGSVLGYSRRLFYWPSLDETQASVYEAFEEAFWYYGGVTKFALVDNAGSLVIDARPTVVSVASAVSRPLRLLSSRAAGVPTAATSDEGQAGTPVSRPRGALHQGQ